MTFLVNGGMDPDFLLLNQDQMKQVVNLVWCIHRNSRWMSSSEPSTMGTKFQ